MHISTRKGLASDKEEIKFNNIIKQYKKKINFDVIKQERKEYNPNWPEFPDHPNRILITGSSASGKINSLFNLINQQSMY